MTTATLPSTGHIQELLAGLFGDAIDIKEHPDSISDLSTSVAALYVDDSGTLQRAMVCDLAFANSAGAALTMIPPGVVKDAIKDQEIPGSIMSNLYEVLNICVNIFAESRDKHLVLSETVSLSEVPDRVANASSSSTFKVKFPRYGEGLMTLMVFN